MAVLICGGAGYIGSHNVRAFSQKGEEVIVIDSLETGHRASVPEGIKFYHADIRDAEALDRVFSENQIEAVIHFCAYSLVGESMEKPLKYFDNNIGGMISLLEAMQKHEVKRIIFSSTAATYGEPKKVPILETDPTIPTNPYGESKLTMEKMMHWVSRLHGIGYVSLRYFNVAGAWHDGSIGEDHHPESHLVPLILQVPLGKREHITIYGDDYPTQDGTCIRDYIHVEDLARAHILALEYLRLGRYSDIFNLGSGDGYSVMEMITAARKVTGHPIPAQIGARRPGDPAKLVADSSKAQKILNWTPKITRMEDIIATAWKWHSSHPNGYNDR
ncbi:MAG: UDP-glucose 4-epimerase GalE [Synergistaceae bacterium]|nr:UDP-glucose 4-epimerase GalE [Synergistaceae bacterium]